MRNLLLGCVLVLAGCDGLHEAYVKADEKTYIYASPKLKEWAQMKQEQGDDEWVEIVNDKDASWKARIEKAKKAMKEDE